MSADSTGTSPITALPPPSSPPPVPPRPSTAEHDRDLALVRKTLESDYDVVAELGRGGMAVVYLARERQLDREVAIKVLRAALAVDSEFVERFKHEARIAGQLEHPNIVPIYRVGQSGHVIYFVMKYLRGQSLGVVLRERGKLHVPEIRHILLETASALGYAAKRTVVHRDIKPDNILLDHEGRCVVTDFGIAKGPGGTVTAPGTSLGTPRYMSPEHAQGTPLDGRSDMYSLGVVAYQCLTGRTPFEADDPFAILYKHINEPLPRPTLDTPEEEEMFAVIERMLAKRAEDRFQSANELTVALGGEVSGPVLADGSGPLRRALLTPTLPMVTPLPVTARERWRRARGKVIVAATVVAVATAAAWQSYSTRAAAATDSATTVLAAAVPAAVVQIAPTRVTATPPPRPAAEPFSRCPRLSGPVATRDLVLMVDSIGPQRAGAQMPVSYDVCGLARGAPYTTEFTVRKVAQSRFRRIVGGTVKPTTVHLPDVAYSPRTRKRHAISLAGLPGGDYAVDVVVVDGRSRRQSATREFSIADR
jgi:predicted Ser/Thr protein kinase